MARNPFKFKVEEDADIIKSFTSAFNSNDAKFSMKDLDEYLTRLGKNSPTMQDAIRFGELSMKVSTIFPNDLTVMFPARKLYIEKDAGIESLKNYFKLTDSMVSGLKALLNRFDAGGIEKMFKPLADRIDTFNATQQQQQQQPSSSTSSSSTSSSSSSSSSSPSPFPFPTNGENTVVMKPIYMEKKACRFCNGGSKLFKCSRCKSVFYCGVEHQKQDFGRHNKKECKPLG